MQCPEPFRGLIASSRSHARTVQESARSHYDRKELQRLFELQPRAAQQLMAALPNIFIGRARLVEREVLSNFLRRLINSENPMETFARMPTVDAPPRMMTIERGEVRVTFQTLEDLAEAMLYLATVFTHDLEGFARLYEPSPILNDEDLQELSESKAELAFFKKLAAN